MTTKIIEGAKERQPAAWKTQRYDRGMWVETNLHLLEPTASNDLIVIPLYDDPRPSAEVERMREALRRLIDTYKDMQDGDGNPCPDVAFAREVLNGGSDAG